MPIEESQDEIKENLLNTSLLIKNLSETLNLKPEYISYIFENFKKKEEDMSIKELALLNEMLVGACLKQLA